MTKILWKLLKILDNNWGYSTPLQERFKVGDECKILFSLNNDSFKPGEVVTILETGRHDYLVGNRLGTVQMCVYQFELYK